MVDIDKNFDDLYFGKYMIPTYDDVIKLIDKSTKEVQDFFGKNIRRKILVNQLMLFEKKFLYFDSQTFMLFRLSHEEKINRKKNLAIILPSKELLEYLKKNQKKRFDRIKDKFINKTIKLLEQLNFEYLIKFIKDEEKSVDEDYSNVVRPYFTSYLYHTNPMFYTEKELEILKKNFGENFIDYEMTSKIILKHLKYIYDKKYIELIQKYTLLGGFKMNSYLRNKTDDLNLFLESNIVKLWEIINDAPKFDKHYKVFRFITNDFLDSLKVNDIMFDFGFMSCTRNFFYRSSRYTFGDILLIIHIPKNIKGVALCVEGVSVFSDEMEVLFSPKTNFRIIKKDYRDIYVSINDTKKIKVYELEFVNKEKINLNDKKNKFDVPVINFEKLDKEKKTFDEKITLLKKIIQPNNLFHLETKNETFNDVQLDEWKTNFVYDTHFYKADPENFNGIHYFLYNESFWIEMLEMKDNTCFFINFIDQLIYNKRKISDEQLLNILLNISKYFEPNVITLNSNYANCKENIQIGGFDMDVDVLYIRKHNMYQNITYNVEMYEYLKNGKKRFKTNDIFVPLFKYENLDKLKKINVEKVLDKYYDSELYMIYKNLYLEKNKSIANFIIWLCDNMCYMLVNFFNTLISNKKKDIFSKTSLSSFFYYVKILNK